MPKVERLIQARAVLNHEPSEGKEIGKSASFENSLTRSSVDEFHIDQVKSARFMIRTARSSQPAKVIQTSRHRKEGVI